MDKSLLIELVREHPPLWDQRDKKYYNRDVRAKLWKKIGEKMNIPVEQIKKQWELLRDVFRKELKKIQALNSDQGTDYYVEVECKWPYFNSMMYLKDFVSPRKIASNICAQTSSWPWPSRSRESSPESELSTGAKDAEMKFSTEDFEENPENFSEVSNEASKQKLKRRNVQEQVIKIENKKLKHQSIIEWKNSEEDEDLHFFLSIVPHMRKFTDLQKMKVRMEILAVITKEMENSTKQQEQL